VVVVTAAAGTGIGSAVVRRCLDEGAQVVISDQHQPRLAALQDEMAGAHGVRVWSHPCDVTDETQVGALMAGAVQHFGRIDVLINNAGLGGTSSVLDMTDEEWLRVLDVSLTGWSPRATEAPSSTTRRCWAGAPSRARRTTRRPRRA
jgi:3-oxoacyl-[acyl-carrier protein] reductase